MTSEYVETFVGRVNVNKICSLIKVLIDGVQVPFVNTQFLDYLYCKNRDFLNTLFIKVGAFLEFFCHEN